MNTFHEATKKIKLKNLFHVNWLCVQLNEILGCKNISDKVKFIVFTDPFNRTLCRARFYTLNTQT